MNSLWAENYYSKFFLTKYKELNLTVPTLVKFGFIPNVTFTKNGLSFLLLRAVKSYAQQVLVNFWISFLGKWSWKSGYFFFPSLIETHILVPKLQNQDQRVFIFLSLSTLSTTCRYMSLLVFYLLNYESDRYSLPINLGGWVQKMKKYIFSLRDQC